MATSPALAWSLNNGISQAQFDQNIVNAIKQGEAQGLSDAQFESLMNQYQISAADVARATQSTAANIQGRMDVATPTTAAEIAYDKKAMDELAARQVQNQTQIAANQKAYEEQQRLNEIKNQQQIASNLALSNEQKRLNEIKNQEQIATNQKAYEAYLANQAKIAAGQTGGAGVLEQNFRNYTSIPIGAQYNPNVVGGTGSPYSQIMGQMKPFSNPYAGLPVNTPMGGYDPGLYDRLLTNAAAKADVAARAGSTIIEGGGPGGSSGPGVSGPSGDNADGSPDGGGNAGIGGDGSPDGGGNSGYAMGGMVNSLLGPNPMGPDDGMAALDRGEYVIKKSSVNKYGRGLLDMINEGKVPAKKLKSLLG